MSKSAFTKSPATYQQQVDIIKERGLHIPHNERAIQYLQQIGYYRLSAFFLTYQQQKDQFNAGTEFQQIIDLYRFDRVLRLLVFDCIERIEVAIRTQLTYILAHKYNTSHWHDIKTIYKPSYTNKYGKLSMTTKSFRILFYAAAMLKILKCL